MNKEKFIEMLNNAKEDEYGRLYVLGDYNNKIYFGTITTICEDIFNENSSVEIYDRHFWNDDTLECYVVSNKHDEEIEYKTPKRIEELKLYAPYPECENDRFEQVENKINELIKSFNRYECLIEKSDKDEN